jgi:hypothetical protein
LTTGGVVSYQDGLDPDAAADGVDDEEDRCAGTRIPDPVVPRSGELKKHRYALMDDDLVFDQNTVGPARTRVYTTIDTGGCNASQIADAKGLGRSHYDHGLSQGVLNAWVEKPALVLPMITPIGAWCRLKKLPARLGLSE